MTLDWNLDGRVIVNWKTCDWQPFPALGGGETGLTWHPIRSVSGCGDGTYLMKVAPGGGVGLHVHTCRESFVILDGALVDGDGTVLVEGDVATYDPGTRHHTDSPEGCTLMVWSEAPVDVVEGEEEVAALKAGRRIVNWKTAAYERYPGLPETADQIDWCNVRADPETGQGLSLVRFAPGASSRLHEHKGWEEFIVLDGMATDPDGTTYRTGDAVSLPPGSVHASRSDTGCIGAVMIEKPLVRLA